MCGCGDVGKISFPTARYRFSEYLLDTLQLEKEFTIAESEVAQGEGIGGEY